MHRTEVCLDENQARALKHLAAEDGRSVAYLLRQGMDGYLSRRLSDDTTWRHSLDELRSIEPDHESQPTSRQGRSGLTSRRLVRGSSRRTVRRVVVERTREGDQLEKEL